MAKKTGGERPGRRQQEASRATWASKYRLHDGEGKPVESSVEDTYRRVAGALARQEARPGDWEEPFLDAIHNGCLPAGRIMANAGAGASHVSASLINCTVSGTIQDSMEGILDMVVQGGLTLKAGCGIGYEFSTLRPRGAWVKGSATQTKGPLPFMEIFDAMCAAVAAGGGRRGAQMATMDIGHPDVEDYIRAKRQGGRMRQFNLSVMVGRDFLNAVDTDGDWALAFPVKPWEALGPDEAVVSRPWAVDDEEVVRDEAGQAVCRVVRTVKARALWSLIMRSTYEYAEPGVLFIDRIQEGNPLSWAETIRATNPCVAAGTWVSTTDGPKPVEELAASGKRFEALVDGVAREARRGAWRTGHKAVLRITTEEGHEVTVTPDHRMLVAVDGKEEQREAGRLAAGDRLVLSEHRGSGDWYGDGREDEGYLLGIWTGYGRSRDGAVEIHVPVEDEKRADAVDDVVMTILDCARAGPLLRDGATWEEDDEGITIGGARLEEVVGQWTKDGAPDWNACERACSEFQRAMLCGMADSKAEVAADAVALDVGPGGGPAAQRMMARCGVVVRRDGDRLEARGEDIGGVLHWLGVRDDDKCTALSAADAGTVPEHGVRYAVVAGVEAAGTADVYDISVDRVHAFCANGVKVHNCGEQALPPYGACLLGSIDLSRYVRQPFEREASVDWEALARDAGTFTRMLDNVVEIANLPLERQRREIEAKRRHGMGVLGVGTACAMLGTPYGSEPAQQWLGRAMRTIVLEGWRTGVALAKEKGPAPILAKEHKVTAQMLKANPWMEAGGWKAGDKVAGAKLHAATPYMRRIVQAEPGLKEGLEGLGARFTHHSSVAPTGTIALALANNASNGIEPSFAHTYKRNVIVSGKATKEQVEVRSAEYDLWCEQGRSPDQAGLPEGFVTSEGVAPAGHVAMQAVAQHWTDSAVSKTVNVPADMPFEEFESVYRQAEKAGLKGCATFRPNPQHQLGVLVTGEDLARTRYVLEMEDGSEVVCRGDELVEYEGETHVAANLAEALKEGLYGRF